MTDAQQAAAFEEPAELSDESEPAPFRDINSDHRIPMSSLSLLMVHNGPPMDMSVEYETILEISLKTLRRVLLDDTNEDPQEYFRNVQVAEYRHGRPSFDVFRWLVYARIPSTVIPYRVQVRQGETCVL